MWKRRHSSFMVERLPGQEEEVVITRRPTWRSRFAQNIPSLIGGIILIVIVVWGLYHLSQLSGPWISTIVPRFSSATSTTTTILPKPLITGSAPEGASSKSIPTPAPVDHVMPADITVRIIDVGVIDRATGAFVHRPPTPYDIAAVQFDVANDGGSSTGRWYFDAMLPTDVYGYPYTSPEQAPLGPGDHIINTLQFAPVIPGGGPFEVTIHAQGLDERNATVFVPMGY